MASAEGREREGMQTMNMNSNHKSKKRGGNKMIPYLKNQRASPHPVSLCFPNPNAGNSIINAYVVRFMKVYLDFLHQHW